MSASWEKEAEDEPVRSPLLSGGSGERREENPSYPTYTA